MGAVVIAVVALVAGSFIVYGNSDGPGDDVQATEMENKDVKAGASGEVTVPMKGNLTTGYDWVVVSLPDELTLVKDWYEADNTGDSLAPEAYTTSHSPVRRPGRTRSYSTISAVGWVPKVTPRPYR